MTGGPPQTVWIFVGAGISVGDGVGVSVGVGVGVGVDEAVWVMDAVNVGAGRLLRFEVPQLEITSRNRRE